MRPEAGQSDRRSLGSNHNSSGRFPKVSIGITIDECQKLWPGETKENGIAILPWGRRPSSQENIVKQKKEYGVSDASKPDGNLIFTNKNASESLSTRCIPHETSTMQRDHVLAEHTAVLDPEQCMLKNAIFVASEVDQTGEAEKSPTCFFTKSLIHEMATIQKNQLFGNQTSVLESQDGVHRRNANSASGNREKSAETKRGAAVAFTSKEAAHILHNNAFREQPKEVAKCSTEALRIKLWEILGGTSQGKQNMDSPNPEDKKEPSSVQFGWPSITNQIMRTPHPKEKEETKRNQSKERQEGKSTKAKHNSDPIETDSESLNERITRPITRSLTQKKAPPTIVKSRKGIRCGKLPLSSSSESKLKLGERNIFAFHEADAEAPSSGQHANDHSDRSKGKMNQQKMLKKIQPPRKLVLSKNFEPNKRERTMASPDEVAPRTKKTSSAPCSPYKKNKNKLQISDKVRNMNCHLEPEANKNLSSPPVAGSAETQQNSDTHKRRYSGEHADNQVPVYLPKGNNNASVGKTSTESQTNTKLTDPQVAGSAEAQAHLYTYKRKRYSGEHVNNQVPVYLPKGNDNVGKTSIPFVDFQSPTFAVDVSPPQRSKPLREDVALCSPVVSRGRISSETSSRLHSDNLNSDPGSPDGTKEMSESENLMFPRDVEEEETQDQRSLSPSNNEDDKSFEASDFSDTGCRSSEEWFFNDRSPPKSHVGFHQRKSVQSSKERKTGKRNEEPTRTYEDMEHYPEDSLARGVCQLALALESFRTKMKSQTFRKSSEILSAAGEEINLQLQHVESQIEANIGKFLTIGKSKRKCLESKFQEQQERLKLIHDKYKEEVDQHLLACRDTLENIEACMIELQVGLDRQKASHRKILEQVEEAIESQLRDAEARVAAIHKEADNKMNGLRHAVKELMSEDLLQRATRTK